MYCLFIGLVEMVRGTLGINNWYYWNWKQFPFFVDVMEDLYNYVNPLNKRHSPMISKETLDIVTENKAVSNYW